MPISNEEKILEKIDQILKLLATQVGSDKKLGERVHLLKIAGLDNQTIADILEIHSNSVKVHASQQKSKLKR